MDGQSAISPFLDGLSGAPLLILRVALIFSVAPLAQRGTASDTNCVGSFSRLHTQPEKSPIHPSKEPYRYYERALHSLDCMHRLERYLYIYQKIPMDIIKESYRYDKRALFFFRLHATPRAVSPPALVFSLHLSTPFECLLSP